MTEAGSDSFWRESVCLSLIFSGLRRKSAVTGAGKPYIGFHLIEADDGDGGDMKVCYLSAPGWRAESDISTLFEWWPVI